jgi:hypothetical protein
MPSDAVAVEQMRRSDLDALIDADGGLGGSAIAASGSNDWTHKTKARCI